MPTKIYHDTNYQPNYKRIRDVNILNKRTKAEKVIFSFIFVFFAIEMISLIFPLMWMVMSSFKGSLEYDGGNAFALPKRWLFQNYITAFKILNVGETSFMGLIFNSLWTTLLMASLGAFMPAITGYVLSKYRFKGRNAIYVTAITAMTIPIVGTTASLYRVVGFLNLFDSPFFMLTISLGGLGGNFLVYYGFFKNVSWSYAEAAKIDGAGPYATFFKIMLPQAFPIISTYLILGGIAGWNEYYNIIMFLPSYPTLASGLFEYQDNAIRNANYPVYFAGLVISMIPTLLLFSIFANKIMTSISLGGLKG